MKNIKSNTFLKTLSCFIFIFSAAAFIMSVLATAAGAYIGFYDEKNKKIKFYEWDYSGSGTVY